VAGAGIGAIVRGSLTVVISTAGSDDRAGALATFFTAGYAGVSLPVVGVGVALQHLSPRVTLLVFGLAVGFGILAATPILVRPAPATVPRFEPEADRSRRCADASVQVSAMLAPSSQRDIRPTGSREIMELLRTDDGELLYVRSRGVRHGSAEVLARLGHGEDFDASEYTFRTATQIQTAAQDLDWRNKGVFIAVAARVAGGVIYDAYLVA
jgi:hypothetical protein